MQKLFPVEIYGFLIKEDKLLLIKQESGAFQGMLQLPGGIPQEGESLEDTLHRVVYEATGIEVLEPGMVLNNFVYTQIAQEQNQQKSTQESTQKGESKKPSQVYALVYILDEFDDEAFTRDKKHKNIDWYAVEDLEDKIISPLVSDALETLTGASYEYSALCDDEDECENDD